MNLQTQQDFNRYQQAPVQTTDGRHMYGNPHSRFTLLMFSDLECPFCKRFHHVPKSVVDESGGLVNWQWNHMPLPMHNPAAAIEAEASEVVAQLGGNRAFWVFVDEVFRDSEGGGRGASDIESLVSGMDIDPKAFSQAVNSRQFERQINVDSHRGAKMGIQGTPTTVVVDNLNGNTLVLDGSRPSADFIKAIETLINDA